MIHIKPLYMETEALGVNLGDGLLQLRGDMSCGQDKVSGNAALFPIAFASKSVQ